MIKKLFLLSVVISGAGAGAMNPADFAYRRPLTTSDSSSGELASLRIDTTIYRTTKEGFSDMRIFDEQGREVAYMVRTVTVNDTDTVHYRIPLKTGAFRKETQERAAAVYYREKGDSIPTMLNISTPTQNFEKSVSVLGSNDQKRWESLVSKCPVFDYTQFIDFRNTAVAFKRREYRYYKVLIDRVWSFKQSAFSRIVTESGSGSRFTEFMQQQEPFRIDNIEFGGKTARVRGGEQLREREGLNIEGVYEDTMEHATILLIKSHREPVDRLLLSVATSNFTRSVVVYATNDTAADVAWKEVGTAEIASITMGDFSHQQLTVSLGTALRYRRYQLKIVNRDSEPVSVAAVTGEGPRHEVLFFHRDVKMVYLYYGAAAPVVPEYDIATVLAKKSVVTSTPWIPGQQETLELKKNGNTHVNSKYILVSVLVVMVIVLLIVLGMAVRKVDGNIDGNN